ncbi:uncharacterized protein LOC134262025 [Saccostrea cucullata]|uniref:uncharacterized protein LOC134262025 n=1 Tax=Saccostrea cuccullata TaxID=36930 RepID=UPI002ED1C4ED
MTKSDSQEAGSSPLVKQLLDEPETFTTIDTGFICLYNVASLSDEEIWTSGAKKSKNRAEYIAVTKSGDLAYTDTNDRTVNILKNEKMEEVIRLLNWRPNGVCITYHGDLLVTMLKDNKQSKVVHYTGSTEKQTIRFSSITISLERTETWIFACLTGELTQ